MKQQALALIAATACIAGFAACAQVPGGSVVPAQGAREPMNLRAIPIRTPPPTPSPTPKPHHGDD